MNKYFLNILIICSVGSKREGEGILAMLV